MKAPRVHHAARRRGGGVAARGARAAAGAMPVIGLLLRESETIGNFDRIGAFRGSPRTTQVGLRAVIPGSTLARPEPTRIRCGVCDGTGRAAPDVILAHGHAHNGSIAAANAQPYQSYSRLCRPVAPDSSRASRAWRQRHRFFTVRNLMAGKWLEMLKRLRRASCGCDVVRPGISNIADYWLNPFKAAAPSSA